MQSPFRIVVTRLCNGLDGEVLKRICAELQPTLCVQTSTRKIDVESSDTAYEWVFSSAAKYGDYDVDWDTITPLDEQLVEDMRECESVCLQLMVRWEGYHTEPHIVRHRQYLRHLRYWNHILETQDINLYLSSSTPHETHEYVIYSLCKLKGIPTVFANTDFMRDTSFLCEDWEDIFPELRTRYEELVPKYPEGSDIPLPDSYEDYYQTLIQPKKKYRPWWYDENAEKKQAKEPIGAKLARITRAAVNSVSALLSGYLLKKWARSFLSKKRQAKQWGFYKQHAITPDFTEKYIYLPLHLQPECSTCPISGAFVDQTLMAQMMAHYLPDDVYVYVKDHPHQDQNFRDMEFYKDLLAVKNVRLVDLSVDTFDLIENSIAVATGSGTAGFEALFKQKPALMFGHRYYQYAPGIFSIRTNDDCKQAIAKILNDDEIVNLHNVRIFLRALADASFRGMFNRDFAPFDDWNEEQNIASITEAFLQRIKSL